MIYLWGEWLLSYRVWLQNKKKRLKNNYPILLKKICISQFLSNSEIILHRSLEWTNPNESRKMLKRKNFLPQLIQIIFNIIARVYSMYKVSMFDRSKLYLSSVSLDVSNVSKEINNSFVELTRCRSSDHKIGRIFVSLLVKNRFRSSIFN